MKLPLILKHYLYVSDRRSTMNNSKNNIIGVLKYLVFSSLIYGIASNDDIFHSPPTSKSTGIKGKPIELPFILKQNNLPSGNITVQLLKDGHVISESDRIKIIIDRIHGKFLVMIGPLQCSDNGNYSIMYGNNSSEEIVLNIIQIPSKPKTETIANKNQLEVRCTSEKTCPLPKLSINMEELDFHQNDTQVWVIKTVPIRDDMMNKNYTCVVEVAGYKNYTTITGMQITKYLEETAYENTSPAVMTTRPTSGSNGHEHIFNLNIILLVVLSIFVLK